MTDVPARRPGDQILDRYCPHLTSDEREIARTRLNDFVRVMIRIEKRLVEEAIRRGDSLESIRQGRILATPIPPP